MEKDLQLMMRRVGGDDPPSRNTTPSSKFTRFHELLVVVYASTWMFCDIVLEQQYAGLVVGSGVGASVVKPRS
jgi:hypothetical protein